MTYRTLGLVVGTLAFAIFMVGCGPKDERVCAEQTPERAGAEPMVPLATQNWPVQVEISAIQTVVNEPIYYRVIVGNGYRVVEAPCFPALANINLKSSSGEKGGFCYYQFEMMPGKVGRLAVPSIPVYVTDKLDTQPGKPTRVFLTQAFELDVLDKPKELNERDLLPHEEAPLT
ncbi:MAG: hypothetical protein FWC56_00635, partial [Phycisphaerae bacterium]|nr:hypothetical protein [Phycisphaerae bacterium]